jgi:hypothetical protein
MAGITKISVFLLLIPLIIPLAAAAQLDVEVSEQVQVETYDLEFEPNASTINRINATAENTGSSSCLYSLRGVIGTGNSSYIRYSNPVAVEAGEAKPVHLSLMPVNYSGSVEARLYSAACDKTRHVGNATYLQTGNKTAASTYQSITTDISTTRSGFIQLTFKSREIDDAALVPKDHPATWKVGADQIENGKARTRILPSVFKPSYNITYAVVQNETAKGRMLVNLREHQSLLDRIGGRLPRTPWLAAASLLANLMVAILTVLFYRQSLKRALAKIR